MRIMMIGAGYPPDSRGGTEVHQRQLAQAMKRRGHEVLVLCRDGAPEGGEPYGTRTTWVDGIQVHHIRNDFHDVRGLPDIFDNPRIDAWVRAHIQEWRPDVVHLHHVTGLSTGILDVARAEDCPVVFTLHDFWTVCPRGQRIRADLDLCTTLDRTRCAPCLSELWPHFGVTAQSLAEIDVLVRDRLRRVDRLLTPSSFHRDRMLEVDLDPQRVKALPHGLDHDLVPPAPARSFPPRRIGFLGSVIPSKGVHVLIEAMNKLGNPELECHVFGEAVPFHGDRNYLERLKSLARSDLPFFFHGPYEQQDLPSILASIDIVVVPSLWWESFCLTIREAMLAGIPVLASDLGAMHEALADLHLDLLFRPGDAQDLAWKLYALGTDEDRFAAASRLRHQVRDLDTMAAETEAEYRAVLANGGHARSEIQAELDQWKRRGTPTPYATVFIPTWNGGPLFERVLERVLAQETDFEFEVLCIDSGSRDGTVDVIKARPRVRLIEIPNTEFNHGLTRNRAVREARGRIVALLTQDAEPEDTGWLQRLVNNFDDPTVAGAYCHQLPRTDCNPFQMDRLRGWTKGQGEVIRKRLHDQSKWQGLHPFERYKLIAFDDVASCVRKSVMDQIPFEKRQFGEDVAWGRSAILSGHTLVMDPRSVVIHSHNNSVFYEFKRVYLDHQNLYDLVGLRTVPSLWLVLKFSAHAWLHLSRVVLRDPRGFPYRAWWLLKTPFYAFTQNLAQYLGALSQRPERPRWLFDRLDRWLRKGV